MKKNLVKNSISFIVLGLLCLPMATSARHIIDADEERKALQNAMDLTSNSRILSEGINDEILELDRQRKKASAAIQEAIDTIKSHSSELNSQKNTLSKRHQILTDQLKDKEGEEKTSLQREITETEGYLQTIERQLQEMESSNDPRLSTLYAALREVSSPFEPRLMELTRRLNEIRPETEEHIIASASLYNTSLKITRLAPIMRHSLQQHRL